MAFPVDEKYILATEEKLGVRFPPSFRVKMKDRNGGGVDVGHDYFCLYPFYDSSDRKRIKRTCNSIVRETEHAREHYRFPKNLIAIGDNGGGDILVYKISENGLLDPTVYWFDHETNELVFAADDFAVLSVSA